MPFEHACFISYRHHEQSELAEKFIEDLVAALRNELTLMLEEDIFIDRERMNGGTFFNPALARALCQSVCMIVVYTPIYFSKAHLYCAREYRAMEQLELTRLAQLKRQQKEHGLIIPLVLRGEAFLPSNIRGKRIYYNFERFSLTSREMARNRKFEEVVQEIARVIVARREMLDPISHDLTCGCDDFVFPTEEETLPWLTTVAAPPPAFPFRGPVR